MLHSEFKDKVLTLFKNLNFHGQGYTEQTVISFKGALNLAMLVTDTQEEVWQNGILFNF